MIIAPPTPSSARATISTWAVSREGGHGGGDAEQAVSEGSRIRLRPTRSAECAEEDQQRGADERVDVDDPEQFDRAGPEVLGDGGHRHVQHRSRRGRPGAGSRRGRRGRPSGWRRPRPPDGAAQRRPWSSRTCTYLPRCSHGVRRGSSGGYSRDLGRREAVVSGPRSERRVTRQSTRGPRRRPSGGPLRHRGQNSCGLHHSPSLSLTEPAPGARPVRSAVDNRARDRSRTRADRPGACALRRAGPGLALTRPCAPGGLLTLTLWSAARDKSSVHAADGRAGTRSEYTRVAELGYGYEVRLPNGDVHSNLAFFPLAAVAGAAAGPRRAPLSYADAGFVVALLASLAAAWGIFAVTDHVYGGAGSAGARGPAVGPCCPSGSSSRSAYSESLFTALARLVPLYAVPDRPLGDGGPPGLAGGPDPAGGARGGRGGVGDWVYAATSVRVTEPADRAPVAETGTGEGGGATRTDTWHERAGLRRGRGQRRLSVPRRRRGPSASQVSSHSPGGLRDFAHGPRRSEPAGGTTPRPALSCEPK
ncbi:hypothetical protein SALBM311S_01780 [Streptomyces alboniger]